MDMHNGSYNHSSCDQLLSLLSSAKLITEKGKNSLHTELALADIPAIPFLINNKNICQEKICSAIQKQHQLPTVNLLELDQTKFPKNELPENMIYEQLMIPFEATSDEICVACHSLEDIKTLTDHQYFIDKTINIHLTTYDSLCKIINIWESCRIYHYFTETQLQHAAPFDDQSNIIQLVHQIITDGTIQNASDIHIQPSELHCTIRLRIDGILVNIISLSKIAHPAIISRIKILSNLDISETRLPQDGRFHFKSRYHKSFDCRISTCPSIYGEKLVMRLLNPNQDILSIKQLKLQKNHYRLITRTISKPQGLILITGPTGSGKTQTLYTLLNAINDTTKNIITIENPVEITIPNLHQINISHKIQLDFIRALRASLRQDPDIIMIGEIRDNESASIAIQAAQTGHLVFATLHANNTQDTLTRLLNMGIPAFNIVHSLSLIIAQRLLRTLCPLCKTSGLDHFEETLKHLATNDPNSLYSATGCDYCHAGYIGRTAIFELLHIKHDVKKIILDPNYISLLQDHFIENLIPTLWDNALDKASQGFTSLSEITRCIHKD